jgi:hypothetical protein
MGCGQCDGNRRGCHCRTSCELNPAILGSCFVWLRRDTFLLGTKKCVALEPLLGSVLLLAAALLPLAFHSDKRVAQVHACCFSMLHPESAPTK